MKTPYRYSINYGAAGGIILANSLQEAEELALKKYPKYKWASYTGEYTVLVWDYKNDEYYDEEFPDVYECYGE